jgi:hypothetical protein
VETSTDVKSLTITCSRPGKVWFVALATALAFAGASESAAAAASAARERGAQLELAPTFMGMRWLGSSATLMSSPWETAWGLRVAYVGPLRAGFALAGGVRLYSVREGINRLGGGFDAIVHYRFDTTTGPRWVPRLFAGATTLFGPSASNDDLLPLPDLGLLVGAGLDLRVAGWFRLGPAVAWGHPILARRSYTGPIDAALVASFDL